MVRWRNGFFLYISQYPLSCPHYLLISCFFIATRFRGVLLVLPGWIWMISCCYIHTCFPCVILSYCSSESLRTACAFVHMHAPSFPGPFFRLYIPSLASGSSLYVEYVLMPAGLSRQIFESYFTSWIMSTLVFIPNLYTGHLCYNPKTFPPWVSITPSYRHVDSVLFKPGKRKTCIQKKKKKKKIIQARVNALKECKQSNARLNDQSNPLAHFL